MFWVLTSSNFVFKSINAEYASGIYQPRLPLVPSASRNDQVSGHHRETECPHDETSEAGTEERRKKKRFLEISRQMVIYPTLSVFDNDVSEGNTSAQKTASTAADSVIHFPMKLHVYPKERK